jgi:HSP20 family protein
MTLRDLVPWQHRPLGARRAESPFLSLHQEMDRLFDEFWRSFDLGPASVGFRGFEPRVDVEETGKEVRVTAELPGLEQKDFELHLEGNRLTLRGEKREDREDRGMGWFERSYGRFQRTIALPAEVDAEAVTATFKDGILKITLPKTREAQVRTIPIRTE